nr:desulfoferrodoxin family protein [Lebetimonas sp. JH292]
MLLAQTNLTPNYAGGQCEKVQVDFYIVPSKSKLKLTAMSYCTKHGLWESETKEVIVSE